MAYGFHEATVVLAGAFYGDFLDNLREWHYPIWKDEEPPSLLDLVELWVSEGDATHVCESYDVFLLVVIAITAQWQMNPASVYWREPGDITAFCPSCGERSRDYDRTVLLHNALNRTLWDISHAGRRSLDRFSA